MVLSQINNNYLLNLLWVFTDILFGYYYITYYLYSAFEWLPLVRALHEIYITIIIIIIIIINKLPVLCLQHNRKKLRPNHKMEYVRYFRLCYDLKRVRF